MFMFLIVIMIFLGFFCILVLCVDQCEYKKSNRVFSSDRT